MDNYYADKLNSQGLFQVYETAIARVKEYLDSEINFVKERLIKTDHVLELGAGYGRIVKQLAPCCDTIIGMDISKESVELGKEYVKSSPNADMVVMDVHEMFFDRLFDVVLCLQNGLSAMRATPEVIEKILDIVAPGGSVYFSTYSANFWDWRIKWFEEQADKGLLGPLDYDKTKDGVIVCKDGFQATTHTPDDYQEIGRRSGYTYEIQEVDGSSLFLIIHKP